MTFEEWLSEYNDDIEKSYESLYAEYGDCLNITLLQYKEQKYRQYLEENID